MVLSNPTPLADFWDRLPIMEADFGLGGAIVSSRTEDGSTITNRRGTRLWHSRVSLTRMQHHAAAEILSLIEAHEESGAQFLAYPLPVYASQSDPTGAATQSPNVPSIYALPPSGIEIRVGGLPVAYRLQGGEFLGFEVGGMQALHRIVGGPYFAGSEGRSPAMQVVPAIRPGAVTGLPVTLFKPVMRAIIAPASVSKGTAIRWWHSGISFEIIQQLRA